MMTWQDLHHSELTVPQLYALLKLRSEVFVVEQQCVYQDVDGDDLVGENRHLLGCAMANWWPTRGSSKAKRSLRRW